MNRRKRKAFSLIEVVVAILITAVGVLGVTVTLWWGLNASEQGGRMAEASNHARVLLEATMGGGLLDLAPRSGGWVSEESGFNDPATGTGSRRPIEALPFGEGLNIPVDDQTRYIRRITSGRLSEDPDDYQYRLAWVRVEVFWDERGVERSVELIGTVPHNIP
ncbi:MAG: prepilin-type N-terminal cleavage/methylation domain-containing protein [Armatimonadetes bacterium]|nr:prepilin-type N-terminal cleavage/methylation domain-containing protein [Armatimonadota bacterium]